MVLRDESEDRSKVARDVCTFTGRNNSPTDFHKYKLPDRNTLPYRRYKPEPVLESANMILYWVRSVVTDKTLGVNRPYTVPIVRGNKTTFVIDTTVPLTHNLPKPKQRKIRSMKT
jgi:hypothetical protein